MSLRTLRCYDDLGLPKPARVDPLTGYRHYTLGRLLRLHRRLVLRDLGVPLSQVGQLIEDDVSVEKLRGSCACGKPSPAPGSPRRLNSSPEPSSGSRSYRRDPQPIIKWSQKGSKSPGSKFHACRPVLVAGYGLGSSSGRSRGSALILEE